MTETLIFLPNRWAKWVCKELFGPATEEFPVQSGDTMAMIVGPAWRLFDIDGLAYGGQTTGQTTGG